MTNELEGRIQIMCNLSEGIEAIGYEKGVTQGIAQERINIIERMIKAAASKEQIISYGFTEEEYTKAEGALYVNL